METLIKNEKNFKIKKNFYIMGGDFESVIIDNKHYPICLGVSYYYVTENNILLNPSYKVFVLEEKDKINFLENYYLIFYKFIKFLIELNEKEVYVFFHNGSSLDFYLIFNSIVKLKEIENKDFIIDNFVYRNPTIFSFTFNLNIKCKIIFRDSYPIIPFSLDKAGMLFESEVKKYKYDYNKLTIDNFLNSYDSEFWKELFIYLEKDCETLIFLLKRYIDLLKSYNSDITKKNSISSISVSIFRNEVNKFYDYKKYPIHKLNFNQDEFIRKSFFGGVTEIYKPIGYNIKVYDINSMYPSVMKYNDMPIGKPIFTNDVNIDNFFGFVKCKCKAPLDLYRPVLPVRVDGIVYFPVGEFEGTFFSEEIKYALEKGYEIKPYCGYSFERKNPFIDFIDYFYNKRMEDKNNSTKKTFYKLILNSFYGRWGLKKKISKMEIVDNYNFDKISTVFKVEDFSDFGGDKVIIKYNKDIDSHNLSLINRYYNIDELQNLINQVNVLLDNQLSAVHIASAVTSYSRIKILEYSEKYDSLYIDTDSIYTNKTIENSNKLGELKFEGEYKISIFLSSKCYLLYNDENDYKIVFKGLKSPYDRFNKNDVLNIFKDKLNEKYDKLSFEEIRSFVKCFNELSIKKQVIKKTYSLLTNKRLKVYESNRWVDTNPINYNDKDK